MGNIPITGITDKKYLIDKDNYKNTIKDFINTLIEQLLIGI